MYYSLVTLLLSEIWNKKISDIQSLEGVQLTFSSQISGLSDLLRTIKTNVDDVPTKNNRALHCNTQVANPSAIMVEHQCIFKVQITFVYNHRLDSSFQTFLIYFLKNVILRPLFDENAIFVGK